MILLIDPPVTPLDPPEAIRAWQERLRAMRTAHADDPQALACVARAEESAAEMLALAEEIADDAPGA